MLIKNHLLKANTVFIINLKHHHKDVLITGLDAEGDHYAVTINDPSRSFRVPKEGDLWTLPEDEDFVLSQKRMENRITWPRGRSSVATNVSHAEN